MKISLYYRLIVFHVLIGIGVFIVKPLVIVYFLTLICFWSFKILSVPRARVPFYVIMACAYVVGAEVFLRMNNGTFFYEASKYLVIVFMLMGMFRSSINSKGLIYVVYLLFLIPAIFVTANTVGLETNIRKAIAFNLSGPVCLGICALYCYGRTLKLQQIKIIALVLFMPITSMLIYLFLYTPDVSLVFVGTASNFATSGGFGPNQVATVLGLGMFVLASRFFMSKATTLHKIIDLVFLGIISYRAIITFSRGGVITGVIAIISFMFLYYVKVNTKRKRSLVLPLITFVGIGLFTWLFSSIQTQGFIDKRYTNRDAAGRVKEDVSTGRLDLFQFEMQEFVSHPFLGIGVGKVKEKRFEETGVIAASHNEIGRIIAEHGLLGILGFIMLLLTPFMLRLNNKSNLFFYSFYFFWLLTINHSAMRISAPAFIYALSLLKIDYGNFSKKSQSSTVPVLKQTKILKH